MRVFFAWWLLWRLFMTPIDVHLNGPGLQRMATNAAG
jgi:hypothetical protein